MELSKISATVFENIPKIEQLQKTAFCTPVFFSIQNSEQMLRTLQFEQMFFQQ
jgi:hypothetical protein